MKPSNLRVSPLFAAIALACAVATIPNSSEASGAVAGATEYTQVASWAQNFQNFAQQITTLRNQLQSLKDSLDVAKIMKQELSSVTGLMRDAQSLASTVQEIGSMKNDITSALGALDSLRSLADTRFLEISRFKDQFGNRRSVEDYFIESMRSHQRDHKLNQVLRDQEAATIKRLEESGKAIQEHARKIPTSVGVHQAVQLMSTQINNLAAMTADVNRITAARALKQTEQDDLDTATRQRFQEAERDRRQRAQQQLDDSISRFERGIR